MTLSAPPSIIPAGVHFVGEIAGEGDLEVHGIVEGPIRVDGHLTLAAEAMVRGHIHAQHITIRGTLKGHAFADHTIQVDASAKLVGDLRAPRVQVVAGALVRGQVHMTDVGTPTLTGYDPKLHTFSGGRVAPTTSAGQLLAEASSPGTQMAPRGSAPPPRPTRRSTRPADPNDDPRRTSPHSTPPVSVETLSDSSIAPTAPPRLKSPAAVREPSLGSGAGEGRPTSTFPQIDDAPRPTLPFRPTPANRPTVPGRPARRRRIPPPPPAPPNLADARYDVTEVDEFSLEMPSIGRVRGRRRT